MDSKQRRRRSERREFRSRLNRSQFKSEMEFEKVLHRYGLYGFKRNVIVDRYYGDFVWKKRRVIVEVDGSSHTNPNRDAFRDKILTSQGYKVIRVPYPFPSNLSSYLKVIVTELRSKGPKFDIAHAKICCSP